MRIVLVFAAVAEIVTGLALLIVPSLVGQLLLNEELADIAIPVARVTGLALIGLGLACWPGPPILGMLVYSTLVMLYLAYIVCRRLCGRLPVARGFISRRFVHPSRRVWPATEVA